MTLTPEELAELNRLLAKYDQLNFGGEQRDYFVAAEALGMWLAQHRHIVPGARADTYPAVLDMRRKKETLPWCGCKGPWCEGRDRNNRSRRCLGYQIDPDGGAGAP